jgi:hypothetical protein
MRVLDSIERQEKPVLRTCLRLGNHQVFESQKAAFADQCKCALVGIRTRHTGELIARFQGDADAGVAAQPGKPFQAEVASLTGKKDAFQPSGAGSDHLFHRVQAVKDIHTPSLLPQKLGSPQPEMTLQYCVSGSFSGQDSLHDLLRTPNKDWC